MSKQSRREFLKTGAALAAASAVPAILGIEHAAGVNINEGAIPSASGLPKGMQPMNVVMIVFDTLRKDCVGAHPQSPLWGKPKTPCLDDFAAQSIVFDRAYAECLPTLTARRGLYTGMRIYPFRDGNQWHKGDRAGVPGWNPIPEDQLTLSEILHENGYRAALISDLYHQFKPSKNFWRGFDEWMFIRGQEFDNFRSGPHLSPKEVDYWLAHNLQNPNLVEWINQVVMNIQDVKEEKDYFAPRVLTEASRWIERNIEADKKFLIVECFSPHEPWIIPESYRKMYLQQDGQEHIRSWYGDVSHLDPYLIERSRANYNGMVTMVDHWFGKFVETLEKNGLLDNTMVIVTSDHGHIIGEDNYMGKRAYPSRPEVIDTPLFVRYPKAQYAGSRCDMFVQHHDIAATILDAAGVGQPISVTGKSYLQDSITPTGPFTIDGESFLAKAAEGGGWPRDHVTIGFHETPTLITRKWWANFHLDKSGFLLYDLEAKEPFARNLAEQRPEVCDELFALAKKDAGGEFPAWMLEKKG